MNTLAPRTRPTNPIAPKRRGSGPLTPNRGGGNRSQPRRALGTGAASASGALSGAGKTVTAGNAPQDNGNTYLSYLQDLFQRKQDPNYAGGGVQTKSGGGLQSGPTTGGVKPPKQGGGGQGQGAGPPVLDTQPQNPFVPPAPPQSHIQPPVNLPNGGAPVTPVATQGPANQGPGGRDGRPNGDSFVPWMGEQQNPFMPNAQLPEDYAPRPGGGMFEGAGLTPQQAAWLAQIFGM